jgi:hypothetical protein
VNAGGKNLWDMETDGDWASAGGLGTNPYTHSTEFNGFFEPYAPFGTETMYELASEGVNGGGIPQPEKAARQAARALVAAYLNSSFYGTGATGYPLSISELQDMWEDAVAANTKAAFEDLKNLLDDYNNAGP